MKIATWNIYWLGDRTGKIARTAQDERLIADVIGRLAPDVLALQEVVDPFVMERILKLASTGGRNYVIRTDSAGWLTSDPNPEGATGLQKPFLCFNAQTVGFVRGAAVKGGPKFGRKPYAAVLRDLASGREFVAAAVHLRAGFPSFLDPEDAEDRAREASALAEWLRGKAEAKNAEFPKPGLEDVVVLGDFNAQLDDPNDSLDPLALPGWRWENPAPDQGRRETALYESDRLVIDFIILSPTMAARIATPPSVYAWDYDPAFGGPSNFHSGPGGSGDLKGYGVSDHRPVYAVIDF
jgi:endonuclease/exonuclease/phosphatase family metal-dependent hydrolase